MSCFVINKNASVPLSRFTHIFFIYIYIYIFFFCLSRNKDLLLFEPAARCQTWPRNEESDEDDESDDNVDDDDDEEENEGKGSRERLRA